MYNQRLPGDRLTTPEFAQTLAAISAQVGDPITVYINRRGQVIRLGVGTPHQTQIPALELPRYGAERLSGIRCISTQLKPDLPSDSALTSMALQRLDALVILNITGSGFTKRGGGATGYIQDTYLAHLVPHPETNWTISPPLTLDDLSDQDFLDLVDGIESEYARDVANQHIADDTDRVILVGVKTDAVTTQRFTDGLEEIIKLVETAGGEVLDTIQQKRSKPHPQTVVGEGKIQEIALAAQKIGANLIVFDCNLSPSQGRNLETQIGIRVVDRTEVILDIFAQRAQSGAGKLQVELAQLEYMMPRLTGRGLAMSRQGGGIGTRGPGETKLETERRKRTELEQELAKQKAQAGRTTDNQPALPTTLLSFLLTPGLSRDIDSTKRLTIPSGTTQLRLQLRLKRPGSYQSYQAVLQTLDGANLLTRTLPHSAGQMVTVMIPAKLMPSGDYVVVLKGKTADGQMEEIDEYHFSTTRQ